MMGRRVPENAYELRKSGLTCAEFQILALEDLDTNDENRDALIETWRVLQDR